MSLNNRSVNVAPSLTESTPSHNKSFEIEDDLPIDVIADKFLLQKKNSLALGSYTSLESKLRQFVLIVTQRNKNQTPLVSKLTPGTIRHYRDLLVQIPKHRNGISNVTYTDMIKMGLPPISQKTAKDTCNVVSEFLNYCQVEQYPIYSDLKSVLSTVKKPKSKDTKQRLQFSDDQLRMLFESEEYRLGKFKKPSEFWTPLIALFTGARLGEILQLHLCDIKQVEGIWVFDLNDEGDKQLKSENSSRLVPIHSRLLDLGILDFVSFRRKLKKSANLFPEEPRKIDGKFDNYSKRFRTYKNRVGIETGDDQMIDFHSFRHTVRTKLVEASVHESLIDDIIGHSSASASIGKKIYTHSNLIPQKKEAIELLSYKINFEKMKPWNKTKMMILLR
jgi:integrase